MPLKHVVWIKFNDDVPQSRIDQHLEALNGLPAHIDAITHLSCGANVTDRALGHTHGLVVTLRDAADLPTYLAHPEHQRVGGALREDATLLALDYEF